MQPAPPEQSTLSFLSKLPAQLVDIRRSRLLIMGLALYKPLGRRFPRTSQDVWAHRVVDLCRVI